MSSILFDTRDGRRARLFGSEYVYMTMLVGEILCAALPMSSSITTNYIVEGHYLLNTMRKGGIGSPEWETSLRAAVHALGDRSKLFSYKGKPVPTFALSCNTAMAIGNHVMAFIGKFAGAAAGHLLIEGHSKEWVAQIIRDGLGIGVLRSRMGWDDVIALLEAGDPEPVVTHFSGTDSFPRYDWQLRDKSVSQEDWGDLSEEERWDLSEEFLRETKPHLILTDETLRLKFEHEMTIFDILNQEAS